MRLSTILLFACVGLAALGGCSGSDGPSGGGAAGPLVTGGEAQEACDPREAIMLPIELGTVVAAGRAGDGRLYVIDQPDVGEARVFVSEGSLLTRLRSLGGGSAGGRDGATDDRDIALTFEEGASMRRVVVELRGGRVTGMALAAAGEKTFFDELGSEAERLTIVAATELASTTVQNLPGDVVIEYFATVDDGRQLLVTRPKDDWTYEDFRVYFGAASQLSERPVESVTRFRDGGTTHVVFNVSDVKYDAFFPAPVRTPTPSSTPAPTLQIEDATHPLTLQPPASVNLDAFTFTCL